ncbi:MAG TPA: hypothetical protein DCZ91_10045 [Lachnospiraceae bacterium]|nr:hypothetical protein [Lachnospiraceae bacterium]
MPQNVCSEREKKGRMANLELLRCLAMMMVVIMHYLGKGNLLADLTEPQLTGTELAAWFLECFCIVAVNIYMFISGFFLCTSSFKVSRLIQLWLQVWVYSVGIGLLGALTGVMAGTDVDIHFMLTLLFPVSMGHYWFMTAYVFLYLLLPFVGTAVRRMDKRQLQAALALLLFAFCIIKSVLPVRFEMDGQGYDCLWYLCVFVTAAYVRRFGGGFLEKRRLGPVLYGGGCLLTFAVTLFLRRIYLRSGSLDTMLKFCMEYNHILPFLAAIGLFSVFYGIKIHGKAAAFINRVAPYTLGVYLLHENLGLRYTWPNWLGAGKVAEAMAEGSAGAFGLLLLWTAAAVIAVFVCGVLVDVLRKQAFGILHRGLMKVGIYRNLTGKIEKLDGIFKLEDGHVL